MYISVKYIIFTKDTLSYIMAVSSLFGTLFDLCCALKA